MYVPAKETMTYTVQCAMVWHTEYKDNF